MGNIETDLANTPPSIDAIDTTLEVRSAQVEEGDVESYTLALLRDSNKAGKKFGEEATEVTMAVFGDADTETVEGEIADLVYASIVFARSRGKEAKLGNVLGILVARNQEKSSQAE